MARDSAAIILVALNRKVIEGEYQLPFRASGKMSDGRGVTNSIGRATSLTIEDNLMEIRVT